MKSSIHILDSSIAMKIAAGEVIDRPASAVRELLDNALDAEATWISITAEKGGKEYLSISDNGKGMNEIDLQKCWLNHATSKIQSFEDLSQLKTFGFRGEALASLAEIAHLQIASRQLASDHGLELSILYGQQQSLIPKGINQGTQITLQNFFQNVPARLKFLSTDTSEYRAIIQEVLKKALAKPEVHFELIHNGEKKYQFLACSELYQRVVDVFPELSSEIIPFSYQEHSIHAYGFLTKPSWYKSNRNYQYFFVNGRVIEWANFRQQISLAYNNLLPPSRFPAVFCYIDIDTESIDFNVHPQKKEIRFEQEQKVADVVRRALRLGLEQSSHNVDQSRFQDFEKNTKNYQPNYIPLVKSIDSKSNSSVNSLPSFRSKDFYSTHKEQLDILFQQQSSKSMGQILEESSYIGTVFQTYLLFQHSDSMYLVDFHAMHERIRYENILNYHNRNIPSQQIIPVIFETNKEEAELFPQKENIFTQLGFSLTPLSDKSFSVEAIPSILEVNSVNSILRELFSSELSVQESTHWDSLCKMIACKGSSRSGDNLSFGEVQALIQQWKQCSYPQSCPHGRPIVVSWTKNYIDKEFKRTGF